MKTTIKWRPHPKRGFKHLFSDHAGVRLEIQPVRHGRRTLFVLARNGRLVVAAPELGLAQQVAQRYLRMG